MAQMGATIRTYHFGAAHKKAAILGSGHIVGLHRLPKTGPATARIEFGIGIEQGFTATHAAINPWFVTIVIVAGKGPLSPFLTANGKLLRGQLGTPFGFGLTDFVAHTGFSPVFDLRK
jgi:hypothetical protein